MPSSIFQKIISGEIPGDIIHQDEHCAVLRDINPQAPTHLLIVPKKLITRLGEADDNEKELLGHLLLTARDMAKQLNLDNGFRIVINNGPDGGESVPHLHVHLLGGRSLTWPPG